MYNYHINTELFVKENKLSQAGTLSLFAQVMKTKF